MHMMNPMRIEKKQKEPCSFQRRDFWSSSTIDPFKKASYRFNEMMTSTRFEDIIKALSFTNKTPQEHKDPLW